MSAVDFVVEQVATRTGGRPEAVKSLIKIAVTHIPEGTRVDKGSLATALETTRKELRDDELSGLLIKVEEEFQRLGPLKQMLAFSAISSQLDSIRAEVQSI